MKNTIFTGQWKGMAAEVEECSEDTGHSVAHLIRIGMDRVLQEFRQTGSVTPGPAVGYPWRRPWSPSTTKPPEGA